MFSEDLFGFGLRDEQNERVTRVCAADIAQRNCGNATAPEVHGQPRAAVSARIRRGQEPEGLWVGCIIKAPRRST